MDYRPEETAPVLLRIKGKDQRIVDDMFQGKSKKTYQPQNRRYVWVGKIRFLLVEEKKRK